MFCSKCGAQLPDNSQFCSKCGADISASPQKAESETPTSPDVAAVTKRKNTTRIAIAAVAAIVLVAGIGVGAWFYLQSSTGTPVDEEHFPDKSFCSFVAMQLDIDGNGILSAREVEQVTVVDLSAQSDIQDITGIAVFTNLQTFVLGPNTVETVDLSQNAGLIEVNTQAGTTTNIHVPTGFVDNDGALTVGNTNVYEGPDDLVVLAEKTEEEEVEEVTTEGVLSDVQFHNGTLYVGTSLAPTAGGTKGIKDGTAFFKESNLFLFADSKVFWLERTQATSFYSTAIYMANEDGSNQKEVAQYAHELMPIAYTNGWLFYSSSAGPRAKNVDTGEEKDLFSYVENTPAPALEAIAGVHDGSVVMQNKPAGAAFPEYLLVNPQTWEVVSTVQPPAQPNTLYSQATSKGVLTAGSDGSLSQVGYDGTVLWSKTFDFLKGDDRSYYLHNSFSNSKELFIFPAGYEASVQIINLETGDLSVLPLAGYEHPKTSSVDYADNSFIYLYADNARVKVARATGKLVE